jgi:hypothetical protein
MVKLNLLSTKSKYDGLFSGAKKAAPLIPFDSTPSGILKNTVLGLPKASIDVAKGAVEKVASTVKKTQDKVVARAKEVVTNPKVLVQEAKDHVPNFDIAFNFSKQYTPEQQKNEQQKLTNAIAGTTGGEDLVARKLRGSITETAIKYFKDEVNPERIKGALHSLGAPVESIDNLTESLSKAKTTDEVKQAIIEESQKYNIRTTKPQVSDEGIQIAPNLRQRYLMEGRLNPGEPMRMLRDPEGRPIQTQRLETKLSPTVDQTLPDTATSISQYLPDTEGGTLESKLEQLRQTQLKGNGESLSNIIDKEAPDVNKKVGWHDYLKTPEYVLKKVGLENEAKLLRTQYEKYLTELPKNIDKITKWAESLPPESNVRIFKYLDGQPVTIKRYGKTGVKLEEGLTQPEQKVADEIKTWLSEFADRLGLPQDQRVTHYITHLFEDNFIKKEFDPELAKAIQGRIPGSVYDPFLEKRLGALGYKEDTWQALDAYVKRATRKIHMDPALEALKAGAEKLDISVIDYIQKYASRVNLRPTQTETLIDNTFKQLFGYKHGVRPVNRITRKLRQMVYRGTLGLNIGSAVRNLTQGVNTYAELGERFAMKGYYDILTKGSKELTDVGVLRDDFVQDRTLSAIKTTMQKVDKGLFAFFEWAEKINRGAAYYGAKSRALSKGATPEEAIEAAKEIVRKTQFQFGSIDTPVAMQDDLMRTIAQLQSFTLKQVEFLGGKIAKREYAGLIRYIAGSFVMLHTIGKLIGMKPKDIIPSVRFGAPPTLGVPAELYNQITTGKDQYGAPLTAGAALKNLGNKALPLVPVSVQFKKTLQGLQAVSAGKDVTAGGKTRYKIDQTTSNYLRAALFGKNNLPEAQDYFKNKGKKSTTTKSGSSRYSF